MTRVQLQLEQARALRLVNLGLAPDAPGAPVLSTPGDVAAHHLAMQGQDFGAAQWAVASRLVHRQATSDDVVAAFDEGELVRTWPMRGTVHVMARADARWLLDLCGPVALRSAARRRQNLGIDEAFTDTVLAVAREHLKAGGATRDELVAAWQAAGLDFSEGQRRYHSVWYLCQVGDALLGPTREGDNLVVLSADHAADATRYTTEEALAQLAGRYLAARGPASLEDLQQWTKLTKTQCRTAFAAADTVGVDVAGHPATGLVATPAQVEAATDLVFGDNVPRALALAGFDEHLLGYRDRSLVLDPARAHFVDPARNGVFRHTVVLDGQVVGTWRRRLLKTTAPVDVTLFEKVRAADRKLLAAAFDPWGHFIGREPVVSFA